MTEWCQRGHRFQTAIGRAGAGKTTTVAACADAWTAAGYRVLGAAVKGEATRTLAAATGIECETVAWYLAHTDPRNLPLDARTVLVVDEASTLSDRDLDALMGMAAATGASLRLHRRPRTARRHRSRRHVPRALRAPPAPHPELTTTHRLQNPHDRAAAQALRDGRIDDAFDQLAAAGHLHVVSDDLTMYRHVLGRWWDAHREGLDHPMVDRRNSTRRQLNRLAHLLRRVNGELGGQGDHRERRPDLRRRRPRHRPRPQPRPARRRQPARVRAQRRARHHRRRPPSIDPTAPVTRSPSTSTGSAASTSPAASSTTTAPAPGDPRSASTTPTRSPATRSKAPPEMSPPAASMPPPPAPRPTSTSPAAATKTTSTSPPPPTPSTAKPSPESHPRRQTSRSPNVSTAPPARSRPGNSPTPPTSRPWRSRPSASEGSAREVKGLRRAYVGNSRRDSH